MASWFLAVFCAAGPTALVAGQARAAAPEPTTVRSGHYTAEIRRTEYGIPHIRATDIGGVGYGYGYAFAQDNLCTLADSLVTLSGDRSRYFGPARSNGDQLGPVSNLDSDTYSRLLNASGVAKRLWERPAPLGPTADVRSLVGGYVAGVNRYLRDTGVARLPDPTCRAKPWVRPMTVTDMYRLIYSSSQIGGTSSFQSEIANARPGAGGGSALPAAVHNGLGSNGIAIGSAGTRDGSGLLLGNPHFPWLGQYRFYQVQLTVPGRLNVSGVSLYGDPVVEIGHTDTLAWTHTVSTAQRFTLYTLRLVPHHPTSYVVDGRVHRMGVRTLQVPLADGTARVKKVYTSVYGPVLSTGWSGTTATAVRGAGVNNLRSPNEWLGMDQAHSIAQLRAVQARYQALPFVNTIAADSTGRVLVTDASVVPHVTDAQARRCVNTPQAKAAYPYTTILDGSTSGCDWGRDRDAIEPGIFGPHTNPTLLRRDYATNSNDSEWLTNPARPLTAYPKIYGDVGTPRSLRTRLGLDMIARRLHGTDGLGRPGFTLDTLQRTEFGDRNLSAELARDALVGLCRAHPTLPATDGHPVDVRAACGALARWDLRGDPGSRGAPLWREFWLRTNEAPDLWRVPFDAKHPATTPNTLNTASASVRHAFADAVARLRAVGLPLDAPLSAAQYTPVAGAPIAVPGCTGQEGCYNVLTNPADDRLGADGRFPPIVYGSSFVMAAHLGRHGPQVRTILTYSESANPASPHHGDQTRLFARKQWVRDRFTEADIRSDPRLTVRRISGD